MEDTFHPSAIRTGKGLLLLDVGSEGAIEQLASHLSDEEFDSTDILSILLSRHHGDHVDAVANVVDRTDAVMGARKRATPFIDGRSHPITAPQNEGNDSIPVGVQLGGCHVPIRGRSNEVVFAPGLVSLFFPDRRVLIAADALTADVGSFPGRGKPLLLRGHGQRRRVDGSSRCRSRVVITPGRGGPGRRSRRSPPIRLRHGRGSLEIRRFAVYRRIP